MYLILQMTRPSCRVSHDFLLTNEIKMNLADVDKSNAYLGGGVCFCYTSIFVYISFI